MPLFRRRKPSLSTDERRALKLLASSPDGITEALMLAHGFTAAILADLARAGLVTAGADRVRAGGREITVRRVWITDAGRQALGD